MIKTSWSNFKKKTLPTLIAVLGKYGMRAILKTCQVDISGLEHFVGSAKTGPCILMLWHNRLAAVPEVMHNFAPQFIFTAFISKSRDGEPLARLALSYKIGRVLRVGHQSRHLALNRMIQQLKVGKEIMIITPDGPRGPKYELKPGIAVAARESSASIIPFSWQSDRFWQLKTWDAMMIPKPFSRIKVTFGTPLKLTNDPNRSLEHDLILLKQSLTNNILK
jgi:lysophospholipid acyltransferase (LPLAT)-like uncharacterized protein